MTPPLVTTENFFITTNMYPVGGNVRNLPETLGNKYSEESHLYIEQRIIGFIFLKITGFLYKFFLPKFLVIETANSL